MPSTDVAVIGAGQAGLAMSRCLAQRGIGHMLFERGEVGERWRSSTWDLLRLLTPNWMNALPGHRYDGGDPDGFMTRDAFVACLEDYASRHRVPVMRRTAVIRVDMEAGAYRVATDRGVWRARAVVVATGHCDLPSIPAIAAALPDGVVSLHSSEYRNPAGLPDGGVLVVGASASGVQIADELRNAGRDVTLSVGRHVRLPRSYRGRDIFWWLDRIGKLTEPTAQMHDRRAAFSQPSLQLVGRPDGSNVDLVTLRQAGVRLAGRLSAIAGDRAAFAPDLGDTVTAAELKLCRLLDEIDVHATGRVRAVRPEIPAVEPPADGGPAALSLKAERIRAVVWATGFRRAWPWLALPVLTADGEIAHEGGITALPGVYALGFRLLRKRDSNFIGGVGADARALAAQIAGFLGCEDDFATRPDPLAVGGACGYLGGDGSGEVRACSRGSSRMWAG